LHTCANDRIGDAIVRRCLLLSSADSDEANDGANDPAIVRRSLLLSSVDSDEANDPAIVRKSLLLSSADSDEANDGANDPAIVRTEALYPLTQRTLAAIQNFSQANDVGEGASIMPVTTSPMFWRI
jgi:hypothetical protein